MHWRERKEDRLPRVIRLLRSRVLRGREREVDWLLRPWRGSSGTSGEGEEDVPSELRLLGRGRCRIWLLVCGGCHCWRCSRGRADKGAGGGRQLSEHRLIAGGEEGVGAAKLCRLQRRTAKHVRRLRRELSVRICRVQPELAAEVLQLTRCHRASL